MKIRDILLSLSCVVGMQNIAYAGQSQEGTTINTVHYMENGVVLFWVTGSHINPPTGSCTNLIQSRWAIDGTSAGGKVQVSGLVSAYMGGKKIKIIGKGNCSIWGDTETVNYFYTVD